MPYKLIRKRCDVGWALELFQQYMGFRINETMMSQNIIMYRIYTVKPKKDFKRNVSLSH